MRNSSLLLFVLFYLVGFEVIAQTLPNNVPIIQEKFRRDQLIFAKSKSGLLMRSSVLQDSILFGNERNNADSISQEYRFYQPQFTLLPIYSGSMLGMGNPYPEASFFLISKGFQQYLSSGIFASFGPLELQIQPEFIYSQNLDYEIGIGKGNGTEYLEKFGDGPFKRLLPGQSSLRVNFGAFSLGISTENIWWGPGQFNSLLFSNNAFGFQHLTLNTRKPAKTFLGDFEGQLIVGRLEGAFKETKLDFSLIEDWRYVNGVTFSYRPRWISGFYVGVSRVFQQYSFQQGNTFNDYFPIFEAFQKERLVADASNSVGFDQEGVSQQLTGSVRYVNSKAKVELYFEYGRRDHALNWREAILNPEHARAYLFGFQKIFTLIENGSIQLRGEILHQEESIGIVIRDGGLNWGGHGWIPHGFTHRGQMIGPGVGPSSNVQTLEGAWVKGFKKLGLRLERLNRHQDKYIQLFNDPSEQGRWVDFSARILADWQWNNMILSSNINFVNSLNHQWQLNPDSTPDFPQGKNLFSVHSQVSLIYLPKGLKRFPKNLSK